MWTPAINKALGNKALRAQMGWANVFEDLEGQVAVITGGARGLGLSMAQALAKWRAKIALLDVLAEVKDGAETVQRDLDVESLGVVADVTDDRSVAAAFAEVGRTLGSPSILINAAGITVWEDSIDVSRESWQRVIDINLTGTFLCCQALARACQAADKGGAIVKCFVDVGTSREPPPTSSVVSRIEGWRGDADQGAGRGVGANRDPRQRHCARLHAVRDDAAVHNSQSRSRRAVEEDDSGWTNGRTR
jgi:hypothetical protein